MRNILCVAFTAVFILGGMLGPRCGAAAAPATTAGENAAAAAVSAMPSSGGGSDLAQDPADGGSSAVPLVNMPLFPFLKPIVIDCGGKLYFASEDGNSAPKPGAKLGSIAFSNVTLPVFADEDKVDGDAVLIPKLGQDGKTVKGRYLSYPFLCADSFTVLGREYDLVDLSGASKSYGDNCITAVGGGSDGKGQNDYTLTWFFDANYASGQKAVEGTLGEKLGTLAGSDGAAVYAFDGISPEEAVYINSDGGWFIAEKANGYTGIRWYDVMRQRGLYPSGPIN